MSARIAEAVTLTMTIMSIKIEIMMALPMELPHLICLWNNVAVTSG